MRKEMSKQPDAVAKELDEQRTKSIEERVAGLETEDAPTAECRRGRPGGPRRSEPRTLDERRERTSGGRPSRVFEIWNVESEAAPAGLALSQAGERGRETVINFLAKAPLVQGGSKGSDS